MLASGLVNHTPRQPWIGRLGRRHLLTAGLAYLFLLGAVLSGVLGGQRLAAAADGGFVPILCTHDGGLALPGVPAPDQADHGICALCVATGCVAALAVAVPSAPVPAAAPIAIALLPTYREPPPRPAVNWHARSRAPPRAA
jgi:hypothetical protein